LHISHISTGVKALIETQKITLEFKATAKMKRVRVL
jgi:hypothetical protein